jgi:hypothetical protein
VPSWTANLWETAENPEVKILERLAVILRTRCERVQKEEEETHDVVGMLENGIAALGLTPISSACDIVTADIEEAVVFEIVSISQFCVLAP